MTPPLPNPLPVRAARTTLALTKEQARAILWEESDDYRIILDEQCGHRRWSVDHWLVIQRVSDGRFFADTYSVGATESQDERAWDSAEPDFAEVFPVEKVVVEYV